MNKSSGHGVFKKLYFKAVVAVSPRKNLLYTQFGRFPNQTLVLSEKVLPFLFPAPGSANGASLGIILFGSSDGAEPYSLASFLVNRFPQLDFRIRAFDIVPAMIARARRAIYLKEDLDRSPLVNDRFVEETFDLKGEQYRIKPAITSRISFEVGSIVDEALIGSLGQADLVFAQNFLFHLKPSLARAAFVNLTRLLKPRSALFVDGMDTSMRVELTKQYKLEPVNYLIEEVHNDAFVDRGGSWYNRYWGREPFDNTHKDWVRKFGTVYLHNASPA